ncbi:MAG: 4-hydroxy-tetrahydrodipicolinate synthase [Bacteroidetes bacterium]|nr:MAG: 4-hydroxy-tetrahydrodipicolinate synthase [Bacteroidota bacterium]
MKAETIKGTGVALITPFHNYGTIDFTSLGKLTKHVINGGVDFLVALGTTSEAPVLSADEKNAVLNHILEVNDGKVPVIIGVGGNNTQGIVDSLKSIDFEGVSGILSVAPYYNKPNQKGLYFHFKSIAAASPVPVILYNVPGRTSSNISAETTLRLASEFGNIAGIKEASGDLGQVMQIIKNKPEGFSVLSGDDALTYPMLALGADGVISVVANAFPRQFSQMVNLALKGNYEEARSLHYELLELIEALFEDGNPAGIKAALDAMGIAGNNLRLPLVKANKATYNKIATLVNKIKL